MRIWRLMFIAATGYMTRMITTKDTKQEETKPGRVTETRRREREQLQREKGETPD
jgi:hypothetical protein